MEDLEIRKNQAEGAVTMVLVLQIICTVLLKYKMSSIYLVVHTIMVWFHGMVLVHGEGFSNTPTECQALANLVSCITYPLSRYASKIKLDHMLLLA